MGRGGGGGGRSGGSFRSSGRSGSFSRSSSSRSSSHSRSGGSSGYSSHHTVTHHHYGPMWSSHRVYERKDTKWVMLVACLFIFAVLLLSRYGGKPANITSSTIERTKIEGTYFQDRCIDNQSSASGWTARESSVLKSLKYFQEKTGVVPYLLVVDNEWSSDAEREDFAEKKYEQLFANDPYGFLFVLFATPDYDDDFVSYYQGGGTRAVLDVEALDIFADYWYESYDNDSYDDYQVITNTFEKTADRIMTKTTTENDIKNNLIVLMTVVVISLTVLVVIVLVIKRKQEKAKETIAILNTPIEKVKSSADELADKYNHR